jgi:MFS family permease
MPSYAAFAAWTPVLGIASLTMITSANATFQMSVAPEMRGRVMALYMMIFMGGTPFGAPVVGWVGEHLGARWTLIGGGVVTILGTMFAVLVFSRAMGLTGQLRRVDAAGEVVAGRA